MTLVKIHESGILGIAETAVFVSIPAIFGFRCRIRGGPRPGDQRPETRDQRPETRGQRPEGYEDPDGESGTIGLDWIHGVVGVVFAGCCFSWGWSGNWR